MDEKLSSKSLKEQIVAMNGVQQLDMLKRNLVELTIDDVIYLIENLALPDRVKALKISESKLNFNNPKIVGIIGSLQTEDVLYLLERYKDVLNQETVLDLSNGMNENNLLKVLNIYKNKFDTTSLVGIIKELKGQSQLEALKLCKENLKSNEIVFFIEKMSVNEQLSALSFFKEQIELHDVIKITSQMPLEIQISMLENYKNNIEIVSKLLENMSPEAQIRVIQSFGDRVEFLRMAQYVPDEIKVKFLHENSSNMESREMADWIFSMSDTQKLTELSIYQSRLDEFEKMYIIIGLDDEKKQDEVADTYEVFKRINKNVFRYTRENLGNEMFVVNPGNIKGLANEVVDSIGEEKVCQFMKRVVAPSPKVTFNYDEVIENQSVFKRFLEFRKRFKTQDEVEAYSIASAFREFDGSVELVSQALDTEMTDRQTDLLEGVLKEGINCDIHSIEELEKFPEQRHEKLEKAIETEPKEVIYRLLLNRNEADIESVFDKFGDDEFLVKLQQAAEMRVGDSKEQAEDLLLIVKFVKTLNELSPENRNKILRELNDNLGQEFDKESLVAEFRKCFERMEFRAKDLLEIDANPNLQYKKSEQQIVEGTQNINRLENGESVLFVEPEMRDTGNKVLNINLSHSMVNENLITISNESEREQNTDEQKNIVGNESEAQSQSEKVVQIMKTLQSNVSIEEQKNALRAILGVTRKRESER